MRFQSLSAIILFWDRSLPSPLYTIPSYKSHAWSAYFVLRPLFPPLLLYFLGPHRRNFFFFYERSCSTLLPPSFRRLKFPHRRAYCTLGLYFLPSPPRTLLPSHIVRFSLPLPMLSSVYFCTRIHTLPRRCFLPLPYRLGTNSSLSTQMYTRVYILLFRPRFWWSAQVVVHIVCLFPSLSYTGFPQAGGVGCHF